MMRLGIIWPAPMAPFALVIVPIGYDRSETVRRVADGLYQQVSTAGFDALLDDREERPGVLLADAELIGIPYRLIVGERGLRDGTIDFQRRQDTAPTAIPLNDAVAFVKDKVCEAH
jgi:prolyl-tRNA synthetase